MLQCLLYVAKQAQSQPSGVRLRAKYIQGEEAGESKEVAACSSGGQKVSFRWLAREWLWFLAFRYRK